MNQEHFSSLSEYYKGESDSIVQIYLTIISTTKTAEYVWDQSFIVSKLYLLQYSHLLLHVWFDG